MIRSSSVNSKHRLLC